MGREGVASTSFKTQSFFSAHVLTAMFGEKRVGPFTSDCSALSAVFTISRLSRVSISSGKLGSPQGCGMLTPFTMRLAPTCSATGYIALISATGNPARSSSLVITAPLRLQVPHVATNRTPPTPSLRKSAAIS